MKQEIIPTTKEGQILKSRIRVDPPKEGENLASYLRDALKRHSTRPLLADAKRGSLWTGEAILDKVERIATGLIELANLELGQVVLTICDHTDHEVLLALGVIFAGGAIYGSSPGDSYREELEYCTMVKPTIIVANSNLHQMVKKLKRDAKGLEATRIIWIDDPNCSTEDNNNVDKEYTSTLMEQDQVILFDDLLLHPSNSALIDDIIDSKIESKTQNVSFLLTSGSTGRPKVVPNTHEQLVWQIQTMSCCLRYPHVGSGDVKKFILPINESSVLAGDLPLDHGAGLATMFISLSAGSKLVILPSYHEDSFWQGVNDYGITTSIASTTFTYKLLYRLRQLISTNEHKRLDLSSFKFISCCGSKLTFKDLVKDINTVYPHIIISQAYGCTEIGFMSILAPDDCRSHLDSVGNLVPGIVAKVVCTETGNILGPRQRGQLYISSMTKFAAYKCLPGDDPSELYARCHDEEGIFYKTGDYVDYDEEERLYIHGRIKDTLYLMEDWKILPVELEDVVNEHPLVEYSAVVGVPDPDLPGCDAPKAFIKLIDSNSKKFLELDSDELRQKLLSNDRDFISQDIYNFVAKQTSKAKHLRGGVRILDVFPRNGLLAKIDRKVLKQMV